MIPYSGTPRAYLKLSLSNPLLYVATLLLPPHRRLSAIAFFCNKASHMSQCQSLFTTNFYIEQFHEISIFPPIYGSFCRNCTYFHVQFDFIQQILPFCELMLKPLQFQAKSREGSSSWCLAKRGTCAQRVTSAKRGMQLAQRARKSQKRISQRCARPACRKLTQ